MSSGRLIGLDHGLVRIGIAVSDVSWLIARELEVITRTTNKADFERIHTIAAEQEAVAYVIGLPYAEHAEPGEFTQADKVKNWAARFSATTSLPIVFWDEQLTSADAREIAIAKKRKSSEPIDDLAARVILQSYLDAVRDQLTPPPIPPKSLSQE